MSLVQGINNLNNKISTLNLSDSGELRIDETGLISQLSQNMLYLKNFTIDNDLRYLRSNEKCYMTTYNYVGTAELKTPISLWNPSASGKKLFLYRINIQFDNDATNDYATRAILYRALAQPTGGTNGARNNLKLGGASSSASVLNDFSYTTKSDLMVLTTADEPGTNSGVGTYEFPEGIEIAEGEGVFIIVYCNTNASYKLRVANTMFWVELDNTLNYPNVSL